jgi:8-amino-7-oxononanoate synthase
MPSYASLPIDLSGNSYLSLQNEDSVRIAADKLCKSILSGNLASRLVSSSSRLFEELEAEIAEWKNTETALVFNSGYAANTGVMQALANRSTVVFCDRLNHASIIDGIVLSGAKLERYRHADMSDLKEKLEKHKPKDSIIITDSVFSMDGDRAPLADICELGKKYGCMVIVDEAHATGIFGRRLSGLVEHCKVEDGVHVRIGTLSKAIAGMGGFAACSGFIRDCLANKARSLIFSTALPHSILAWNLSAIRWIKSNPLAGAKVLEKAVVLRDKIKSAGFETLSGDTQIIPCITVTEESAISLSAVLKKAGIAAPAIRPPTVPANTSRVRFSVNRSITQDQICLVGDVLADWKSRND